MRLFKRKNNSMHSSINKEASESIAKALDIINNSVKIYDGLIQIKDIGSEGLMKEAVKNFERAHLLHPDNPQVHFAYASSLLLAGYGPDALTAMKKLIELNPNYELAQIAVRGWDRWQSVFTLPILNEKKKIPDVIGRTLPVDGSGLFALREGILPVSAVIYRDSSNINEFAALQKAKINMTTVISEISDPQVIGIYIRVYDDPQSPYTVEVLYTPFLPRGEKIRNIWEYFAIQKDLIFIIIDSTNTIMFQKSLNFNYAMMKTNKRLKNMFKQIDGQEISQAQTINAMRRHQSIVPIDFKF